MDALVDERQAAAADATREVREKEALIKALETKVELAEQAAAAGSEAVQVGWSLRRVAGALAIGGLPALPLSRSLFTLLPPDRRDTGGSCRSRRRTVLWLTFVSDWPTPRPAPPLQPPRYPP